MWIHPVSQGHAELGENHTLEKELSDFSHRFYTYFHLDMAQFDDLIL